jgi:phage terminase small subunit
VPILSNSKHERFAQEVASGKSLSEAYVIAGYAKNDGNAVRLKGNEKVKRRIEEILAVGAEKAGVTVERVLTELAKIGFSDIRKIVKWRSTMVTEEDNPDGGETLVVKNIWRPSRPRSHAPRQGRCAQSDRAAGRHGDGRRQSLPRHARRVRRVRN